MGNATIVYFDEIWNCDKTTRIFRTVAPKKDSLWVSSFENGIVTINPTYGSTITSFAEIIAGCFDESSNFTYELSKAMGYSENTIFTGIKFDFNGITIMVTKENANKDKILANWNSSMKETAKKQHLKMEAYMKTPEYLSERAKLLKIANRRKTVQKDIISIDESTELYFKNEEAAKSWIQWTAISSKDSYKKVVITYARRWAKYMQYLMEKHNKTVDEIATSTSYISNIDDISGFMYNYAVSLLTHYWKYGEELNKWYKPKYE